MSYHSNLAAEQAEQDYFDEVDYNADWRRWTERPMKRLITQEDMRQAVENARKDHPRVRRIIANHYGVKCSSKCQTGIEHVVIFYEESGQLYAECEACPTADFDTTGFKICRHIAAAYGLYLYYSEQRAA